MSTITIRGSTGPQRPVAEARVQGSKFQPLDKIENGSRPLADEGEIVERQREKRYKYADDKRHAVPPPRLQQFVEAE